MSDENEQEKGTGVKFDGSHGYGAVAELTVYTKVGETQEKEEVFSFPYVFIDFSRLVAFDQLHLIKGYRVIKNEKPSVLKDLGL